MILILLSWQFLSIRTKNFDKEQHAYFFFSFSFLFNSFSPLPFLPFFSSFLTSFLLPPSLPLSSPFFPPFLLPLLLPSWFSSDPPRPGNPKTYLCFFCPAISCWHFYSPIRNNLGAGSQSITWVYMGQPSLGGLHLALQYIATDQTSAELY